jgi:hypothetical protein
MGSNPSTVMPRAMACAHWRAHGAGVPSPCGPGRRRRSSRGWRRRAWGPSGWAHRCGCGGRRNKAACVRGLAAELPGVPHRYGAHPFLREVATPVLAADSRAQVQRRPTVRGWRASAREGLAAQRPPAPPRRPEAAGEPPRTPDAHAAAGRREVGRDDWTAVRGLLHDAPGGPRPPPGRRLATAWGAGRASLRRPLAVAQGGQRTSASRVERATSTGGLPAVPEGQEAMRE